MSVTRVRIEAEGRNHHEVLDDLNGAFGLLFGSRWMPRESEFIEEVVETHIRADGAIEYRGRRVMRFLDPPPGQGELVEITPDPDGGGGGTIKPLTTASWVVSGSATTQTSPTAYTIGQAAQEAASCAQVTPYGEWEVRDSAGSTIGNHVTLSFASNAHPQPWYFQPLPGTGA